MFDFYDSLDSDLKAVVSAMTLMNEPAHSMPQDGDAMVRLISLRFLASIMS